MGANKSLMCDETILTQDLSNKVIIVTGGNSGIGKTTAIQLAKQGATVVIACRRSTAGEQAAGEINSLGPKGKAEAMVLDLASLASVRSFAEQFKSRHTTLNCLVNNAGVMNTPESKTTDGFEMQFGTNHLGHFLLTNLLTDLLKASAPSRVVNLSSVYHNDCQGRVGHINFEDLNFETRKYDGWLSYSQSKLANLLHARELARRLDGTGVTAASVHPGFVRSNLINHTMGNITQKLLDPVLTMGAGMIEPWEGAQTSLHVILSKDIENGAYYAQNNSPKNTKGGWPYTSTLAEAHDDKVALRLWEESETLVASTQ
jgi:NAD(P)-dependent dehydrogenase (short-subunit alcohol dehydrogenase family)